ncbi:hypothetical protein [Paralcaligenes ureilyticus]|uniref:Minor curlin subunit n=1 Tax=Paralcaligenes ureilyticus TaxID=627131 RepID=A0A4R3MAD0_9BURK|nr:hypothetical protein [Paralcaligenes ureilyticus]TCT10430.1 minor curlin subunit [Paralcaligenes ureilyticus]
MIDSIRSRYGGSEPRRYGHALLLALALTALGTQAGYCLDTDLGAPPELTLGDSTASIFQIGRQNTAGVQQQGSLNTARLSQAGSDNGISAAQQGNGNSAFLTQAGAENLISLAQYGNANYASAAQFGYANTAAVAQFNNAGDARIAQVGNLDSATVITLSAGAPPVKLNQYGNGAVAKVIQY